MAIFRIDWREAEEFFFSAMLHSWAANGSRDNVADLPGFKEFFWEDGNFMLVDQWCAVAGETRSAGTTTIWRKRIPIWVMQYGGWHREEAIAAVKEALKAAYEKKIFMGGRGEAEFFSSAHRFLVYRNQVHVNNFTMFKGAENVFAGLSGRERKIGFYHYNGMALVES